MRVVLAAHLPVLTVVALLVRESVVRTLADVAPLATLLGVASARVLPARFRALAASLGLIGCSALLVHLSGGVVEAHFHYFVAVTLVAVYEDALIYLAAVVFVLVEHGIVGLVDPGGVFAHSGNPWPWAAVHAAAILAQSGALLVFWHYSKQARQREGSIRAQLYDGHNSLLFRQEQLARLRTDLVGTISHEFRTPLTGIRGTLQLLQRHGDRLPPGRSDDLLERALAHTDRLARLIDNMLAAAQPDSGDGRDPAPLATCVEEAVDAVRAAHTGRRLPLTVSVSPDVVARMPCSAVRQVLTNLLDNAVVHGQPDTAVRLAGWRDGDQVIVTVANEAPGLATSRLGELFEPFSRADTSTTREREGAGMGLYVVRRLVEHHGGTVSAHLDGALLTVRLVLPIERRAVPAASEPAVTPVSA